MWGSELIEERSAARHSQEGQDREAGTAYTEKGETRSPKLKVARQGPELRGPLGPVLTEEFLKFTPGLTCEICSDLDVDGQKVSEVLGRVWGGRLQRKKHDFGLASGAPCADPVHRFYPHAFPAVLNQCLVFGAPSAELSRADG